MTLLWGRLVDPTGGSSPGDGAAISRLLGTLGYPQQPAEVDGRLAAWLGPRLRSAAR